MGKRVFGVAVLLVLGFVAWIIFRRNHDHHRAPQLATTYVPPMPDVAAEIEDALETAPIVREADPVELAFVTGAINNVLVPEHALNSDTSEQGPHIAGYCMHCHERRDMLDAHEETAKDGRRMARGTCPVCGSTIVRFVKENRRVGS